MSSVLSLAHSVTNWISSQIFLLFNSQNTENCARCDKMQIGTEVRRGIAKGSMFLSFATVFLLLSIRFWQVPLLRVPLELYCSSSMTNAKSDGERECPSPFTFTTVPILIHPLYHARTFGQSHSESRSQLGMDDNTSDRVTMDWIMRPSFPNPSRQQIFHEPNVPSVL